LAHITRHDIIPGDPIRICNKLSTGIARAPLEDNHFVELLAFWGMMLPLNRREHDTLSHRYLLMAKTMMNSTYALDL
jgi:hypothetical protein